MNTNPLPQDFSHSPEEARHQPAGSVQHLRNEAAGMCRCATNHIRQYPICSVLTATAVGVALGWLLGSSNHHAPWHERALHDLRDNADDALGKLRHSLKFW